MPRFLFIALTVITLVPAAVFGQQELHISLGGSFIAEDFPEGRSYHVWLASAGYAWRFFKLGKDVSVYSIADVQYGDASSRSQEDNDFDIAANLTLEILWQVKKTLAVTASIGSGPGYQSSVSIVQARGIIFSNNFSTGFKVSLAKGALSVSPQVRFRHMSNASLKSPNQGIDNFLVLVGMAIPLRNN